MAPVTRISKPRRESEVPLEQAKILRVFQLLDLLLQPWGQSVKDLAEALGSDTRTVYRYLRLVGEDGLGYRVVNEKGRYRIPDTGRLTTRLLFTPVEETLLLQRLADVGTPNPVLQSIRRKVQLSAGLLPRPEELPALQRLVWAEQLLKFGAVGLPPRLFVGEHLVEGAVLLSKRPQLVQLVLGILALGLRRYPGINGYSHTDSNMLKVTFSSFCPVGRYAFSKK